MGGTGKIPNNYEPILEVRQFDIGIIKAKLNELIREFNDFRG